MNSDKDKGDNQKRFHLLWVSPWFVKLFLRLCDWSAALCKECQKKKKSDPPLSTSLLKSLHPPLYSSLLSLLSTSPSSLSSLSPRSRPVASRLAVTHLAPPEAHNRRLVCEEGQEFSRGWGSIPPCAQRRPALRVYNYLLLAFSTGSSTVQALAPAWGDALGYTLGD